MMCHNVKTKWDAAAASISDPYTFYTDPDPGILPNMDPVTDPALNAGINRTLFNRPERSMWGKLFDKLK